MRESHCDACGQAYPLPLVYPRACAGCGAKRWANPTPVSVVLVPVRDGERVGLLAVRRAGEPRPGMLALVGGFLEAHETWAAGGAREIREETGIEVDASTLESFYFASTSPKPDRVILFSVAAPIALASVGPFRPNDEVSERGLVFGPAGLDDVFAFPLHVDAARRWFVREGIVGPHAFRVI